MNYFIVFFFNDTATTEIYTLSLHDALPIYSDNQASKGPLQAMTAQIPGPRTRRLENGPAAEDRKSTRLNSSHSQISYAVFCLKKKKIRMKNYAIELFSSINITYGPQNQFNL